MNRSIRSLFNSNIRRAATWAFLHFGSYGRNRGQNSNRIDVVKNPEDAQLLTDTKDKAERKRARIRSRNLDLISSGGINQFSKSYEGR